MTCHADKAALRNYVCTCPIEIYTRSFVSVLVPRKNGTLVCFKKKKRLWEKKKISRYLKGNGDNSKFSILFSINVLSFFFYYCEKSKKFVLHLLFWKRVYIRVSLLDIQYNIRIQFQNRFIVIPSATLQFRFHLFRIILPNDFLYSLRYVIFSIQFVSFH